MSDTYSLLSDESYLEKCKTCFYYRHPNECHQQGPNKGEWNDVYEHCSYTRAVIHPMECGPDAKFWEPKDG